MGAHSWGRLDGLCPEVKDSCSLYEAGAWTSEKAALNLAALPSQAFGLRQHARHEAILCPSPRHNRHLMAIVPIHFGSTLFTFLK